MKLLTTFYNVESEARLAEFRFCIEKLCSLNFITEYHIFFEGCVGSVIKRPEYAFLNNRKIVLTDVSERPSYKTFIDYANIMLSDEIVGIVNADIYFDESVKKLESAPMVNHFYVVTRINRDGAYQNPGSQDFWVFKTPLAFSPDIYIGVIGCDSYLAQKALEAGYIVRNPCLTIHIYHHHNVAAFHKPINLACGNYWSAKDYRAVEISYSELP